MDHTDFRDRVEWLAQSLMSLKIIRGPRNLSEPWISNVKNRFQPLCGLCASHVGADRNQTPESGQILLHSWGFSASIPFSVRHRTLPEFWRAGHGCGRVVNVHVYRQRQKISGKNGRSELTEDVPPHPENAICPSVVYPNTENG